MCVERLSDPQIFLSARNINVNYLEIFKSSYRVTQRLFYEKKKKNFTLSMKKKGVI